MAVLVDTAVPVVDVIGTDVVLLLPVWIVAVPPDCMLEVEKQVIVLLTWK